MSERKLDLGMNAMAIALGIMLLCVSCALWAIALSIVFGSLGWATALAILPASLGICFSAMAIGPFCDGITGSWKK